MAIAFLGYILPFGQMSFWGATVITNLLSFIPYLIEWICGGYYIYNPTLKRFFLFHFILPFILLIILLFHIFYLHIYSSNNSKRFLPDKSSINVVERRSVPGGYFSVLYYPSKGNVGR